MKGIIRNLLSVLIIIGLFGCASSRQKDGVVDESGTEAADGLTNDSNEPIVEAQGSENTVSEAASPEAEIEKDLSVSNANNSPSIEDEFNKPNSVQNQTLEQEKNQQIDPFASDSSIASAPTPEPTPQPMLQPSVAPPIEVATQSPLDNSSNSSSMDSNVSSQNFGIVEIKDLKFKANDNGGTVVIVGSSPMTFTTRQNESTKQFVIEVPNANLPAKLKRTLNTKDIKGVVGAIDAYQANNNSARFVIQMREGASFPVVQQEGNSLIVITDSSGLAEVSSQGLNQPIGEIDNKILANATLDEFLSSNTQFYGKKISLEMNDMDIREALRFITDESGANIVISDEIRGKLTLKLRQVPWDQALVVIMKAKQLGYSRSGNVIRISTLKELKQEEEDSIALSSGRRANEPLMVKVFTINYAKMKDVEDKIKPFLTKQRGQVIGDERTNNLVVTDTAETLGRIDKLLRSLDVQPSQVLIEGKIIEASELFQRAVGINWGLSGNPINISKTGKYGPVNMMPSLTVNPLNSTSSGGGMGFNLMIGTLDAIGNLTAALSLSEREDKVKVISSPRIVTLSNEAAEISQTTKVPVPKVDTTTAGSVKTYTYEPIQLKLNVTPQITSDASIIMKINVKRDIQGAVNATDGSFSVGSREANSKVLVRNGQTAVIGGIYQSDVTDGESGVPFFKDLPFVGGLFKAKAMTKDKRELLIFVTPRIMGLSDSQPIRGE